MAEPDYIICLECESPLYVFDWRDERILGAVCMTCGNEDPALFATEEQLEELSGGSDDEE